MSYNFFGFPVVPFNGNKPPFMPSALNRTISGNGIFPGSFPIVINWQQYFTQVVFSSTRGEQYYGAGVSFDFSQDTSLDNVRSVFIDNTNTPHDVYVQFPDSGFTAYCPAFSQQWHAVHTFAKTCTIYAPVMNRWNMAQTVVYLSNVERTGYSAKSDTENINAQNYTNPAVTQAVAAAGTTTFTLDPFRVDEPDDVYTIAAIITYRPSAGAGIPLLGYAIEGTDERDATSYVSLMTPSVIYGYPAPASALRTYLVVGSITKLTYFKLRLQFAGPGVALNAIFNPTRILVLRGLRTNDIVSFAQRNNAGILSTVLQPKIMPNGYVFGFAATLSPAPVTDDPIVMRGSLSLSNGALTNVYAPSQPWQTVFENQTHQFGVENIKANCNYIAAATFY